MTNVRKTDDKNQIFIVCPYLTMFFRADVRDKEIRQVTTTVSDDFIVNLKRLQFYRR